MTTINFSKSSVNVVISSKSVNQSLLINRDYEKSSESTRLSKKHYLYCEFPQNTRLPEDLWEAFFSFLEYKHYDFFSNDLHLLENEFNRYYVCKFNEITELAEELLEEDYNVSPELRQYFDYARLFRDLIGTKYYVVDKYVFEK